MNKHIFDTKAGELSITGYGKDISDNIVIPIKTDSQGRMILSPDIIINAVSAPPGLDIRPLDRMRDSAGITVQNLDIRALTGTVDGVTVAGLGSFVDSDSDQIGILTTTYLLPVDTSPYSRYSYLVKNTSGVSVGVNITLQAAPDNVANHYLDDGSSFSLLGGNMLILQPSVMMKFARVKITSLLSIANVQVYFFGQV